MRNLQNTEIESAALDGEHQSCRRAENLQRPRKHEDRLSTATASQALSDSGAEADFTAEEGTPFHIKPVVKMEGKPVESSNEQENLTGITDPTAMKATVRSHRGRGIFTGVNEWDEQSKSLHNTPDANQPEELQRSRILMECA